MAEHHTTHGLSDTPEHRVWIDLRARCRNPNHQAYGRYGGRGITVCERWRSFEAFLADMGPRPSPEHSIDRVDNDGSYSPENCRWATPTEQNGNRRPWKRSRRLTAFGRTLSIREWASVLHLPVTTIYHRLDRGYSDEEALQPSPPR